MQRAEHEDSEFKLNSLLFDISTWIIFLECVSKLLGHVRCQNVAFFESATSLINECVDDVLFSAVSDI